MTQISYIHGIPQNEVKDRARTISAPQPLDYTVMTEGEVRLSLMREQLQMLADFYPEATEYRDSIQAIDDTLNRGLHATANISGFNSGLALYEISRSRFLNRPAVNLAGLAGIGSVANECREERTAYEEAMKRLTRAAFWNVGKRRKEMEVEMKKLNDCLGILDFQRVLNSHLEGSSHHLLYNYVANPNAVPATVSAKTVNHRVAVENLARTSGLSKENIATWVRNGVMRYNAKQGINPFQPEETINILATEIPGQGNSVSGPFIAALPLIIKAIAAAVGATALLLAQMKEQKRQEFTANLQGIGNPSFGPEQNDWLTGGSSGGNNETNFLPIFLAAAGVYALS